MSTKTIATGITRFENAERHTNGYMVRLCRNGQHINEFFSDSRFGGKMKAKKAAVERYEQLVEEYGPAVTSIKGRLTSRNTTGIVGIHVAHGVDNRWPDCEYWSYCASWVNEDGSRSKISFSWNKYGERDALALAMIARKREIADRATVLKAFARQQAAELKRRKNKAGKRKAV